MSTAGRLVGKDKVEPREEPLLIEGSFACMSCDESVDEAFHFVLEKVIGWKCSKGHWSEIEVSW